MHVLIDLQCISVHSVPQNAVQGVFNSCGPIKYPSQSPECMCMNPIQNPHSFLNDQCKKSCCHREGNHLSYSRPIYCSPQAISANTHRFLSIICKTCVPVKDTRVCFPELWQSHSAKKKYIDFGLNQVKSNTPNA